MRTTILVGVCLLLAVSVARADSLNCRLVGTYNTPGTALNLAVVDSLIYVADIGGGLRIISAADPQNPYELGSFPDPTIALGVAVHDTFAYIANHAGGIYVVNVADPANPTLAGQRSTPAVAARVAVKDTLLYVANRDGGMRIYNVANPANITEIGYCDTMGIINDVAVVDTFAYVTSALPHALLVENVTDPTHPTMVGSCTVPQSAEGLAVSGAFAYVATGQAGLRIINVANPLSPSEVGHFSSSFALDVAVAGSFAYVADGYGGLRVVDVSNPADPNERGFYDTPSNSQGVALLGDYVCIADDDYGVYIVEFYGAAVEERPPTPDASRITPGATIIRGVLFLGIDSRQNTAYRAELLDAAGREVRDLKPGANDVRRLAPGVYFARSGPSAVRKVMINR